MQGQSNKLAFACMLCDKLASAGKCCFNKLASVRGTASGLACACVRVFCGCWAKGKVADAEWLASAFPLLPC